MNYLTCLEYGKIHWECLVIYGLPGAYIKAAFDVHVSELLDVFPDSNIQKRFVESSWFIESNKLEIKEFRRIFSWNFKTDGFACMLFVKETEKLNLLIKSMSNFTPMYISKV